MDADEIEKNYQESVERLKSLPPLLAPSELLGRLREIQEQTQRQAETGRIQDHKTTPPPAARVEPNRPAKKPGVLLEKFRGAGSTPSRRRFWDKITQAVAASQKQEGRNVSVDVRDGYGTVINVDRKAGTAPPGECVGDSCLLPDGNCPHALCLSFKATRPESLETDEYWDRGNIAELGSASDSVLPYFYLDGSNWKAGLFVGGAGITIEVLMSPDDFFNNSHQITLRTTITGTTTYTVEATAYGSTNSSDKTIGDPSSWGDLFIGSHFANNIEPISICGIQLLGNSDTSEEDFIFPDDSFTSTIGSGQSISGGTVTITGDASAGSVGYSKTLDPVYDLECEPPTPTCTCQPTHMSISWTATDTGDAPSGEPTFDQTFTAEIDIPVLDSDCDYSYVDCQLLTVTDCEDAIIQDPTACFELFLSYDFGLSTWVVSFQIAIGDHAIKCNGFEAWPHPDSAVISIDGSFGTRSFECPPDTVDEDLTDGGVNPNLTGHATVDFT